MPPLHKNHFYDQMGKADLVSAKANYQLAIKYYKELKNAFLTEVMNNVENINIKGFAEDFVKELDKELTDISVSKIEEINERIKQSLAQMSLSQGFQSSVIEVLEKALTGQRSKSEDPHKMLKLLLKRINTALESNEMVEQAYETIVKNISSTVFNHGNNKQMNSAEFGLVKRNLLSYFQSQYSEGAKGAFNQVSSQLFSKDAMSGYIRNLGGAYLEEAAEDAINDAIQKLSHGASSMRFSVTADQGDSTNMYYDLITGKTSIQGNILSSIMNILKEADSLNGVTGDGKTNVPTFDDIYYGIQSKKGWSSKIFNKNLSENAIIPTFYSVGSRVNLAKSLGFEIYERDYNRGWHHSAYVLSILNNLFQAIGQSQLGYVVQNQFIWMEDLIQSMHNQNLYLTFYYTKGTASKSGNYNVFKYPTTGEIAWQAEVDLQDYRNRSRLRIQKQKLKQQKLT